MALSEPESFARAKNMTFYTSHILCARVLPEHHSSLHHGRWRMWKPTGACLGVTEGSAWKIHGMSTYLERNLRATMPRETPLDYSVYPSGLQTMYLVYTGAAASLIFGGTSRGV